MADSIRQLIVATLEARMKTITPANGYTFDLSSRVDIWRDADYAIEELPRLNILDHTEEDSNRIMGRHDHALQIELNLVNCIIAGETGTPKLNANQIRALNADIYKALGVDIRVGGYAYEVLPGKTEMDLIQNKRVIAAIRRTITVKYQTLKFDPFTQ